MSAKSRGVTLVELSIVLAILGILVIVGVSGRSLLDIARATATIEQINSRSIAFQTFEATYGCVPGDCALTTIVGASGSLNTVGVGDGNGKIGHLSRFEESFYAEEHFYKAGLFSRPVTISGTLVAENIYASVKIPNFHIALFTLNSNPAYNNFVGGVYHVIYQPSQALNLVYFAPWRNSYLKIFQIIESKLDDGDITTGNMRCGGIDINFDITPYPADRCTFVAKV